MCVLSGGGGGGGVRVIWFSGLFFLFKHVGKNFDIGFLFPSFEQRT